MRVTNYRLGFVFPIKLRENTISVTKNFEIVRTNNFVCEFSVGRKMLKHFYYNNFVFGDEMQM